MSRKNIPPFPRLAGRLYFFPALLPFAAIAPWLLTALGVVTGAAGLTAALQRHRKKIIGLGLVLLLTGGGVWLHAKPSKVVAEEGTQRVAAALLPVPQVHAALPAGTLPAATPFGEMWRKVTAVQVLSSVPVIVGERLIFGSYQGSVEAMARQDGTPLWSLKLPAYVFSLAAEGGVVYAGTGLHQTQTAHMTAIDAATGKALWQREFLGHIENPVGIDAASHRLFLGSGPGGLWAVDTHNGDIIWHAKVGHADTTPLLVGEVVYAPAETAEGSRLFALDAETGAVLWQAALPGQPWGTPLLNKTQDALLITSGQGQIGVTKETDKGWAQAVSLKDGRLIWQKNLSNMAIQPDVYHAGDDIIIHALKDGQLLALRGATGEELWKEKVGEQFQSGVTLLPGDLVAATTFDGIFTIRRLRDGAEVAQHKVGTHVSAAPAFADDTVYAASAWSMSAFGRVSALAGRP